MSELEILRTEEITLAEEAQRRKSELDESLQRLEQTEWRLQELVDHDRLDHDRLAAFNEASSLDEVGVVLQRRAARDVLMRRARSAIEYREAEAEQTRRAYTTALAPLNRVRGEIARILDREQKHQEEIIRLTYERQANEAINAFRATGTA